MNLSVINPNIFNIKKPCEFTVFVRTGPDFFFVL